MPTLNNQKIGEQFGQDNPASGIKDTLLKNKDINTMLRDVSEGLDKKIEQAEAAKK